MKNHPFIACFFFGLLLAISFSFGTKLHAQILAQKEYLFTDEPIDVVIPSIKKDLRTLDLCIAGIKENCSRVRRVIVVSDNKLTDKAEWFNENMYPFSKKQVALCLCQMDKKKAKKLLKKKPNWVGWYYQQLLKLYAPFVIPGISSNVLILDSDSIFLNPVEFLNEANAGMYHPGNECIESYYVHARKFLPGFTRLNPAYSGISHHMLFQKCVLEDLFNTVTEYHQKEFWKAFCLCADPDDLFTQGASEYEIYFNFLFSRSTQPTIRFLKHKNVFTFARRIPNIDHYKQEGFHYGSFHMVKRE